MKYKWLFFLSFCFVVLKTSYHFYCLFVSIYSGRFCLSIKQKDLIAYCVHCTMFFTKKLTSIDEFFLGQHHSFSRQKVNNRMLLKAINEQISFNMHNSIRCGQENVNLSVFEAIKMPQRKPSSIEYVHLMQSYRNALFGQKTNLNLSFTMKIHGNGLF